ncbi:VF530 family protein [Lentisphaera marina]|uniref:VF530 family protein n=1 Tax=Lentisphaera marina TaxID=1111041 RepID=UPI0023669CBB|nr:VF530 family protein [Lentisphaera marina]MDD7987067.1 VF530 family protein [Lentisphaera marina]
MTSTEENNDDQDKTADGLVPEVFNEEELDELVYGTRKKNPMDGVTLKIMLINLEEYYGWEGLGERIEIRCFNHDPSMKSSLKFLRKNEWARKKVEKLYEITFL